MEQDSKRCTGGSGGLGRSHFSGLATRIERGADASDGGIKYQHGSAFCLRRGGGGDRGGVDRAGRAPQKGRAAAGFQGVGQVGRLNCKMTGQGKLPCLFYALLPGRGRPAYLRFSACTIHRAAKWGIIKLDFFTARTVAFAPARSRRVRPMAYVDFVRTDGRRECR